MTNVGVVKSVEGNLAKVFVGGGCCGSCQKDSCDIGTARGHETEAINLVHAKVGQKVRIDIKALAFLKGVLVLYALPFIALLTGAILGRAYLPAYFRVTSPVVLSAAGGFFLFLISLLSARFYSRKMEKKAEDKPVIESIIEE